MIGALVFALAGCSKGGGSGSAKDLIEACLESTNMERPLCECVAKKASEELSPDGVAFLVASLKGDEDAATELRKKLDMSEMVAAGMFMTKAPGQCAAGMGEGAKGD